MKEEHKKLLDDGREYLKTRYDLLRLELLDKLSLILSVLILIIVALFLLLGVIAYFSVALIALLANVMPIWVACCIIGGVLLLLLPIMYVMRQRWFIDPFIKLLSSSLFAPKDEEDVINTDNNETVASSN